MEWPRDGCSGPDITTEGVLEIDHPVLSSLVGGMAVASGEGLGLSQIFQVSPEAELALEEGLAQSGTNPLYRRENRPLLSTV